jgi:hypothetical protein
MSSAAGIPTGWQVVERLIRRVAAAENAELGESDDPAAWWAARGHGEPRYADVLAALAPTDAARQQLLRGYFEPAPGSEGPRQPTSAHHDLAGLCVAGRVRVILTTNFDRLVERAIENAGVAPQVVADRAAIDGMLPLAHAPVTVIKLHGDYASLGLRNTVEELRRYPDELQSLVERVFDEYGLVAVGWSSAHDHALRDCVVRSPKIFPMYFAARGGRVAEDARQMLTLRGGFVVPIADADSFLRELNAGLERLDRVAASQRRTLSRIHLFPIEQSARDGWEVAPPLHFRVVASDGPFNTEEVGLIGPVQRESLRSTLEASVVSARIRALMARNGESWVIDPLTVTGQFAGPSANWIPTPASHQSTERLSQRLGGDGTAGVSAVLSLTVGGIGAATGSAVFMLDVGIAIDQPLRLGELATLARDALQLMSGIHVAVADILPSQPESIRLEVHVAAPSTDGHNHSRGPNRLDSRVQLEQLGAVSRNLGDSINAAALVPGPLDANDAALLTLDLFEFMALANGFLDPRPGLASLRAELGVMWPDSDGSKILG